jgi:hypothetical protein
VGFADFQVLLPAKVEEQIHRYSRQMILPGIGGKGRRKLAEARVFIMGAGGLGSPAAIYLAAAGVWTISLADFDRVELHNLQRHILYKTPDIGLLKVDDLVKSQKYSLPIDGGRCEKIEIFPLTLPSPARGEGKYIEMQREIPSSLRGEGQGGGGNGIFSHLQGGTGAFLQMPCSKGRCRESGKLFQKAKALPKSQLCSIWKMTLPPSSQYG